MAKLSRVDQVAFWCADLPHAELDYPFGPQTGVYKVAGKMFALFNAEADVPYLNLKVDPPDGEALRLAHPYIRGGYHMNKKHWVTVDFTDEMELGLLDGLIEDSYSLIVSKLPKKTRLSLDLA
jgi:predicted DNA-binding protein (MmcQ/YjbR family)